MTFHQALPLMGVRDALFCRLYFDRVEIFG